MEEGHGTTWIRLASALAVDRPGGDTLEGRELGSRKARTLLALLAAERGALVPLDRIVEALWPGDPPADPAANVATLVSRTRRLLGADLLTATGRAYGLAARGPWVVDLDEASRLTAEAAARAAAGEAALAVAAAGSALELLGSQPALVDEDDADWVLRVRREADGLRRRARHLLAESLTPIEPAGAARVAAESVAADPFDEQAVRTLMRALVADGRASAALAAYDDLAARLREELGTSPDRESVDLHVSVLREADLPAEAPTRTAVERTLLVGREPELAQAERTWAGLGAASTPALVLVEGEAGIGKTRFLDAVADLAAATGGRVLRGRCHPAERSLFLQPFVDALRPAILDSSPPALAALVRDHVAAWVSLVPELAPVVADGPPLPADVDLQRRQAYDAVVAVLRRLALDRPVLLTIDDLQDGGAATVDLLGYLAGRLGDARVLVVAAVRAEDAEVAARLADRATLVRLGALPRSAVDALAAASGLAAHGEQVMARTAGHPLSVVEYLRALGQGDTGVPESLADAVLGRVARLDAEGRAVVEAAAVLRRRIDPALVAALVESSDVATARECEELVRLRLLVRSGHHYEFANDLLQECVHAALPPALALALHRRAADLTSDRPEVMAEHAYAAGDEPRAAHGWLLAGEDALRRAAVEDALGLLDRSLAVGTAFAGTRARALLARGAVHEARDGLRRPRWTTYAARWPWPATPTTGGSRWPRSASWAATRPWGSVCTVDELVAPLELGLRLAADLGDRRAEADFTSRLAILEASRLRLATALARAEGGLVRARSAGSEDAQVLALDGLKTVWAYLGDPVRLGEVIADLEPRLRARGATWLLQWTVFEKSFVPAAEGRLDDARALIAEALELNRLSGYPAYAGYLHAHDGWFARLAGDLETARRVGREAVEASSPIDHPWWYAIAAGLLAATLIETGDAAEAEAVARRGLATGEAATAGGRLRCLAALAALTGDPALVAEAREALDAVECPPGDAWVTGADVYLLLGSVEPLSRAIDWLRCAVVRLRTPGCLVPASEHLEHQLSRPVGAVRRHGQVVGRGLQRRGQLVGDPPRVGVAVVQRPAGPVPLQPVPHVHLLLEVVAERDVQERPTRRGELHRGAQPALDHGHVARGVVQVEVGQEAVHLHARGRAQRARVDARAGDDHHPEAGDAAPCLVVRRDHAPQQVVADARTAHADHADDLAVGVPEPVPQRLAVGRVGPLPHDVPGEVEVLFGPRPGRRQVRPQRQVDHVGRVADEHRPVAQRGVPRHVLDHLGVVVGGQVRLPLTAVGHRHPPDEVGHPDERRPLELGVLVQEVVEVPGLVAQPDVERLPLHQVVEHHEVVDQHLVHPAHGLERVQVVLARLRLEVPRLVRQQARGRVHDLAALLEELRHRRLGQPLDLEVGPPLAHRVGDGQVAAHVAEPDGRGEVQRPRPTPRAATAGTRGGGRTGDPVHEALDRRG